MATAVHGARVAPLVLPMGDLGPVPVPRHEYDPLFRASTHASLVASLGPESPPASPAPVSVKVFNASDGKTFSVQLDLSDTVGKVKSLFLQARPDFSSGLELACNGRPVLDHQTLKMLNVKETATFITFQKCIGG